MNIAELKSLVATGAKSLNRDLDPSFDSIDRTKLPSASAVYADILRIADRWHGRKPAKGLSDAAAPTTVDGLIAAAAAIGVRVRYERKPLKSLGSGHFPCILLLTDGATRIALGADADGLALERQDRAEVVPYGDLAASYSGLAFFVSALGEGEAAGGLDDRASSLGERLGVRRGSLLDEVRALTLVDQRHLMLHLLIAATLSNLLTLALPLFTMAVYDRVVPHMAMETLWALSIGAVIALGVDLAIRHVRLRLHDAVSLSATVTLQSTLYRRLVTGRLAAAPRTAGGLNGALKDIDGLCQTVPALFVALVVDVPFFLLVLVIMASIAGWVVVAPVIGVMIIAGVHFYAHKTSQKAAVEANRLNANQTNQMVETVAALERVKAAGVEGDLKRRWEALSDATHHTTHQARVSMNFAGQSSVVITQFVIVGVIVIGVYGIGAGMVTLGSLTASTLLVGRAIAPIGNVIGLAFRLKHVLEQTRPLDRFLAEPVEAAGDAGRIGAAPADWTIALKNVMFAYEPGDRPSLADVTLTIKPGERVGIIGRNGCGKSTLLRLVQRFYEPTSGSLTLGGADIRQYDPRVLRTHIGAMPQDAALFDDTLRANIVLGLDDVDQVRFAEATQISGAAAIAERHPKGFDLPVGPRGERLSGGERQTALLARALIGTSRVLILDEPTAAMDPTLEGHVIRRLKDKLDGRTVVIATHRTAILELVDRIIWMEAGKIVADGPKAEILKTLQRPAA